MKFRVSFLQNKFCRQLAIKNAFFTVLSDIVHDFVDREWNFSFCFLYF